MWIVFIILLGPVCCQKSPEKRLIKFDEQVEKWMTKDEIDLLPLKNIKFMDITDWPEAQLKTAKQSSQYLYPQTLGQQPTVNVLALNINQTRIENLLTSFSTDFLNRRHDSPNGVASANWLLDEVTEAAGNVGQVGTIPNNGFDQFNIIARIDSAYGYDEIVILGAHQDSTAGSVVAQAPGADDDGSGSIVILEVFRLLVNAVQSGQFIPFRPIEFHWYGGEEAGLLGSQTVSNLYAQGARVYSMVQFDMVGYPNYSTGIGLTTDFTDPQLNEFVALLIEEYMTTGYTPAPCGYACSDHASFTRNGFPAAFPFETPFGDQNPFIHSIEDTVDKLDFHLAEEFGRLGIGYCIEASLAQS